MTEVDDDTKPTFPLDECIVNLVERWARSNPSAQQRGDLALAVVRAIFPL